MFRSGAPGATENLVAQNAMAPRHLPVPAGTTVPFVNPASNASAHAAVAFFDNEFDNAGKIVVYWRVGGRRKAVRNRSRWAARVGVGEKQTPTARPGWHSRP